MTPPHEQIIALADAINGAEKIAVFAGAGARDAHDEVIALADAVGAPVGHSLRGKEYIQYDNLFDVGMTGLLGYGAAHAGIHDADLLILLGTDFPYSQFLPQDTKTAQVDRDAAVIGRRTPVQVPVHGDVRATLRAVLPLVARKTDRAYLDKWLRRASQAGQPRRRRLHPRRAGQDTSLRDQQCDVMTLPRDAAGLPRQGLWWAACGRQWLGV